MFTQVLENKLCDHIDPNTSGYTNGLAASAPRDAAAGTSFVQYNDYSSNGWKSNAQTDTVSAEPKAPGAACSKGVFLAADMAFKKRGISNE